MLYKYTPFELYCCNKWTHVKKGVKSQYAILNFCLRDHEIKGIKKSGMKSITKHNFIYRLSTDEHLVLIVSGSTSPTFTSQTMKIKS